MSSRCSNCHELGHNVQTCTNHQPTNCRCRGCRTNLVTPSTVLLSTSNEKLSSLTKAKLIELRNLYGITASNQGRNTKACIAKDIIKHRDLTIPVGNISRQDAFKCHKVFIDECISKYSNRYPYNIWQGRQHIYYSANYLKEQMRRNLAKKLEYFNRNQLINFYRFLCTKNDRQEHPIIPVCRELNQEQIDSSITTKLEFLKTNLEDRVYSIFTIPSVEHIWNQYNTHEILLQKIYEKSINILNQIKSPLHNRVSRISELDNSSVERKSTAITNNTNGPITVFWYYKRTDAPDFSECKLMEVIPSKRQSNPWKINKNTHIIVTSKYQRNQKAEYYRYLKSYIIKEFSYDQITRNIFITDELSQWKEATLKLDFLIRELKRFGAENNDTLASIIDLHQDVVIPSHSEFDKDNAGIPSSFTNIT